MNSRPEETRRSPATADTPEACRRLGAVIESAGSVVVLHASGEVDAYTLPRWQNLLGTAAADVEPAGHLVLDLGELVFLSIRAILDLAECARRLRARRVTVHLADPYAPATVARVLAAAQMTEWLRIHRDLPTALAATVGDSEPDDTVAPTGTEFPDVR
ncbi:STAS domain-containing protein [Nocardia halotolerans]|uniref:STAS domain-containing protein n=1 Tax=Nocardia halotolerans TaxID=1755878 RepID=A0ABV8VI87_9NOCA